MIRRPTPMANLLAWHTAAMAGQRPAQNEGLPECGWYKRRLIKGGPWVPARIYVERELDEAGELTAPEVLRIDVEGLDGGNPADHWTYLVPITLEEFNHLTDYRLRDSRMLDARRKLDLSDKPTFPQGVM